jgi:hypothetical protein
MVLAEFGPSSPAESPAPTKGESPTGNRPKQAPAAPVATNATPDKPPVAAPSPTTEKVSAAGFTNRQIWAMALQDLQGRMSGATFAVWMRPAELISLDPDGTLVIGARNRVQRERLEGQYLADLTAVLGKILDRPVGVRVVIIDDADLRSVG